MTKELSLKSLHDVTFGREYKEKIENIVGLFSDVIEVEKPKVSLGETTMYDCVTNTIHLPDEKTFIEDFNADLKEVISEGVAHEMFHHATCVGRNRKNFNIDNPLIDAEEAGADIFAGIISDIIGGEKIMREDTLYKRK